MYPIPNSFFKALVNINIYTQIKHASHYHVAMKVNTDSYMHYTITVTHTEPGSIRMEKIPTGTDLLIMSSNVPVAGSCRLNSHRDHESCGVPNTLLAS